MAEKRRVTVLYFENDYSEGAADEVIELLVKTNKEKLLPYGNDAYSASAAEKIKKEANCPGAQVFFISGGTQTNKTVIDSMLSKYQGVISAETGHIALHEAGAIESAGHKVLTVKGKEGKLSAESVSDLVTAFYRDTSHDHMVFPGMVYISHPTEYGTLYTKAELTRLYETCKKFELPLFIDGARLGYGLAAHDNDLTLADIASLCDVFYIGGTKVGALCGEAVVFTHANAPSHFITSVKQNGAMLAKSRVLGVQFDALFTNGTYLKIAKRAIDAADLLRAILKEKGYRSFIESGTNQIFVIMENARLEKLKENVRFSIWEEYDKENTVIRLATSFATEKNDVLELAKYL